MRVFIPYILAIFVSGCAPYIKQPLKTSNARLGAPSMVYEELTSLPAPKEKIVAAVYKFRDQTGQYKPTEVGSSWSTAVTQGATTILLRSLEESKWFIPIEREGLGDLLNERKIIRSSRANYLTNENTQDQPLLPPLLFAGILLEGGIISYESNILTGGAGVRYFGTGGSAQYREDRITVYLRAVSTSNGRILKTVYTSKTILSQKVDFGVFRYVSFKRLLEAETGFTFNEPSEMAVKEAIDKAVFALVIEGAMEGLWQMNKPEDLESEVVQTYLKEKESNKNTDYLGFNLSNNRSAVNLRFVGGANTVDNDYPDSRVFPFGELGIGLFKKNAASLDINLGFSRYENPDIFQSNALTYDLRLHYRFVSVMPYSPFFNIGFGGYTSTSKLQNTAVSNAGPYLLLGLGYEYLISNKIELSLSLKNKVILDDKLDEIKNGRYNDYIWELGFGIAYYF